MHETTCLAIPRDTLSFVQQTAQNIYIYIQREEQYLQDVESLKASVAWNVSQRNCLPLALKCTIIIYSSDIRTPVYDIIPSTKITQEKLINLAIRGVEHYEVIERIDEVQTPGQCDPLFVEDPIIEARHSNQDDHIDKERVE